MDTSANAPAPMPERYEPQVIEPRWQQVWEERRSFHADDADPRPKMYVLQMFPYPSGDLHAGHIRNYVLGDAAARYWRLRGYNVLHPMGFDSFGLPAEQAAIDRGIYPGEWIEQCITRARAQFRRYGFAFDWEREVVTSDPAYYKWTQWLFLKFHELGLVYRSDFEVNWCEEHGVLANDEVKDGACWRCDRAVTRRKLEQWVMRTTDYAQELLDNLDKLPGWNDAVRIMQRNWIGRSDGSHIDFEVLGVRASVPASSSAHGGRMQAQVDDLTIRKHRLPHWQLSGAVYFISWRLHPDQAPLQPEARDSVFAAITHFDGQRYNLAAAVVMDDHVHVVAKLADGQDLGKTLHSWRSFTANQLQKEFGYRGSVWQDEYFDRIIRNEEEYRTNIEYIINNPQERWPDDADYKWLMYRDIFAPKSAQGRAHSQVLRVFTTRIDTVFGATFMAIAPDHPLAGTLAQLGGTTEALAEFALSCSAEAAQYGPEDERPKRGLALNAKCINPFSGEAIPIFATNYVIASFGTGAVMGVPAHDERDFAFAKEYGVEIRKVIEPAGGIEPKGGRPLEAIDTSESSGAGVPARRPDAPRDGRATPVPASALNETVRRAFLPASAIPVPPGHMQAQRDDLAVCIRRLPHFRMTGAMYFVTWRLMPGQAPLSNSERTIVLDALRHFDGQRYYIYALVVMDDHVHVLVLPFSGYTLGSVLHKWKSFTANRLQREHGRKGSVWQDENHDRIVRDEEELYQKAEYILTNPARRWPGEKHYQWIHLNQEWPINAAGRDASPTESRSGAPHASDGGAPVPERVRITGRDARATDDNCPPTDDCTTEKGVCINSAQFDGLDFAAAKAAMDAWLSERGLGGTAVSYKLRDWNMSRQRFWGAPIPMLHCASCGWQPVPERELPVELPPRADYSDIRVSPLANDSEWQRATCPQCGGEARRETDTMTTFMDSAWYFLRFCDPLNSAAVFDAHKVGAWLPVDYYVGGKEHAVGHLLYSRFVTMVLERAGLLKLTRHDHAGLPDITNEPFRRLLNQGIVYKDGAKMSKSKGNVVSADGLAADYGADTARMFSFFGGPYDMDLEWSTAGVEGCHRFLRRVWRLAASVQLTHTTAADGDPIGAFNTADSSPREIDLAAMRARHKAVAGVTADIEAWRFNTAIAKLMECLNTLEDLWKQAAGADPQRAFTDALLTMAQLLCPFAPHIAEELWSALGETGLCGDSGWPQYDAAALVEDVIELPVQVNGKIRARIKVAGGASEAEVIAAAQADPQAQPWLEGKELVKAMLVPGRLVSFTVK